LEISIGTNIVGISIANDLVASVHTIRQTVASRRATHAGTIIASVHIRGTPAKKN